MNWIRDTFSISTDAQDKLLASFIVVAALLVIRWVVLRAIARQYPDDVDVTYRSRKVAAYTATFASIVTLGFIWLEAFDNFTTYLGLVSAGVAIALADLLKNMAGWGFILTRRPFRVGDRIEVGDTRGDVIDIRLFRFTLMEVGKWVDSDQSTGRLVHVPNGLVFTHVVANYTEGFGYIWHEIPVLVTFESDWRRAEEIIRESMQAYCPDIERKAGQLIRATARDYQIRLGTLTPTVYLTVKDSGVLLTGRFLVDARQRRGTEQSVWRGVLDGFATEPNVALAYPTTRTYFEGPVKVDLDGADALSTADPVIQEGNSDAR